MLTLMPLTNFRVTELSTMIELSSLTLRRICKRIEQQEAAEKKMKSAFWEQKNQKVLSTTFKMPIMQLEQ